MSRARYAAAALAALRIAYGTALAVAPARMTRSWLGPDGERAPAQVPIRALGAREVALHLGALAAAVRGGPVRPWFAASIGGDCADIVSTLAARPALPDGSALATFLVAGASAAGSAAVAAAVDS